jgi:hypothetical protein
LLPQLCAEALAANEIERNPSRQAKTTRIMKAPVAAN